MSKKSRKQGWMVSRETKKQTQLEAQHDTSSIHLKYNSSSPSQPSKKIDPCRDFATNPGSRGMMINPRTISRKTANKRIII